MSTEEVLKAFHERKIFTDEAIRLIQHDEVLRTDLAHYFKENKDRDFALQLLNTFIALRKVADSDISIEDLMLACYLLGLHQQVADCLKIWEAKCIDFDTYCGIDIQLVPFAGVTTTIAFLKTQRTAESAKALDYVNECLDCGDLDDQEAYFGNDSLPWFV